MSYDKNTVNMSQLDTYLEMLDELEVPYNLTTQRKVQGYGVNDDDDKIYPLRRLQYNNNVLLEYIEQTSDCDTNDTIYSEKFTVDTEPENWQYVIQISNA